MFGLPPSQTPRGSAVCFPLAPAPPACSSAQGIAIPTPPSTGVRTGVRYPCQMRWHRCSTGWVMLPADESPAEELGCLRPGREGMLLGRCAVLECRQRLMCRFGSAAGDRGPEGLVSAPGWVGAYRPHPAWGARVPPHHWGSHVPQGWWLVSAMELFAQVVLKAGRSISPSPASQERLITSQGAERSPSLNTSRGRCRQGIPMGQNKREREGPAHAMPRPIFIWRAGTRRRTPACMLDPSPGSHVCRDYMGISREQSTRNQEGIKPAGSTGNRKAPQHPQDMHDKQEMEQRSSLMLCGGREQEGGHSQTPP